MIITVGGQDLELNFGIRFVRELDKNHYREMPSGAKVGFGLEEVVPLIMADHIPSIEEALYAATCMAAKRPSQTEMDDYIDTTDIDDVKEELLEELKKSNATKKQAADAVAQIQAILKPSRKTTKTSMKA